MGSHHTNTTESLPSGHSESRGETMKSIDIVVSSRKRLTFLHEIWLQPSILVSNVFHCPADNIQTLQSGISCLLMCLRLSVQPQLHPPCMVVSLNYMLFSLHCPYLCLCHQAGSSLYHLCSSPTSLRGESPGAVEESAQIHPLLRCSPTLAGSYFL